MDKIIDGKKRKLLGLQTGKKKLRKPVAEELKESMNAINIDRNALMEEELAKLPKLERSEALIQTHTSMNKILSNRNNFLKNLDLSCNKLWKISKHHLKFITKNLYIFNNNFESFEKTKDCRS